MNRSDIKTRIIDLLSETQGNPVFVSDTQLNDVIDEGIEVLSEEVHAIKRTAFVTVQAGTQYYYTQGIAPDMMSPYRLWLPYLNRKLIAISYQDLDMQRERWARFVGDPVYWFTVSWNLIGIYPYPTTGGGLIHIDYLAWPRHLMDDYDEPEIMLADQDSLVLYGVYDAMIKAWDAERASAFFQLFIERVGNAQERHGIAKMDARTFNSTMVNQNAFRSGVER